MHTKPIEEGYETWGRAEGRGLAMGSLEHNGTNKNALEPARTHDQYCRGPGRLSLCFLSIVLVCGLYAILCVNKKR